MLDWMALRSADDYWYYDVVANSANDTQRISSSDLLAPVSKRCLMPSLMARSKPQIPTNPTLLILSASGTKSIPLRHPEGYFRRLPDKFGREFPRAYPGDWARHRNRKILGDGDGDLSTGHVNGDTAVAKAQTIGGGGRGTAAAT